MSIQSWKAEFYPVDADKVKGGDEELVAHSLTKWRGLTEENLGKHELVRIGYRLAASFSDDTVFRVSDITCALCMQYLREGDTDEERCGECPLRVVRGGISCDTGRGESVSPYHAFTEHGDTQPMIAWLERAQ